MTDIKLPNEHLKALKTAREAIQKEGIELFFNFSPSIPRSFISCTKRRYREKR